MATLIADTAASGVMPRAIHAGLQTVYATYTTASGTLSVGDIIQMCKIPDGARVVDGWAKISAIAGSTVAQINFGTRASSVGLIASATAKDAQITRFTGTALMGTTFTVTDGAANRYTMIEALIGGSSLTGTGTISIECCVIYQMAVE